MVLSKYETYQVTGEDWISQLPEHWQFLRTKNIFRLVAEPAPANNDEELLSVYSDIGVKPRRELEERGNKASTTDGYWLVKKGDVIVNKLLAWMGAIGVSDYDGVTSPAYDILRPHKPVASKFYHYLFRNPICINKLKQHSKGIMEMRLRLYFDEFGDIKIPHPPIEEQKQIVKFLDWKTAEIDDAIATKYRLIELLQEQKAILINQAVTKGLDSNVPMRNSGVDWIGEIPEKWRTKKLKYCSKIFRGKFTHRPRNDPNLYDGCYPFIQTGDVARSGKFLADYKQTLNEKGLRVSTLIPKGTVIITIAANIGDIAILGIDACFPDSVVGFQPQDEVERDFLYYVLLSMKQQFISTSTKNTQMNLNVERIGSNFITLPETSEQRKIVEWIENHLSSIHLIERVLYNSIENLDSLKSILIAHIVTGKIKICGQDYSQINQAFEN